MQVTDAMVKAFMDALVPDMPPDLPRDYSANSNIGAALEAALNAAPGVGDASLRTNGTSLRTNMEWWQQPIDVKQEEQELGGATKRRIRLKAVNWTVDVFPNGDTWAEDEPTITIDSWSRCDLFNTKLLARMLKDAINYCEWGEVVQSPTSDELAALNVAPGAGDAPTDAEFAAALEELERVVVAETLAHLGAVKLDCESIAAARARVEALHADVRNAGLRELRAWCEARQEWTTVLDSDHYVYMSILNQITAMLKGGDGA